MQKWKRKGLVSVLYSWKAWKLKEKHFLNTNKHFFCPCGVSFSWWCVGECWEVVGWRRLRERPLLYNISCVSKALTAKLPVVVRTELAMSVFVCGFERGGGGGEQGEGEEGVLSWSWGLSYYLVPITANPKGPFLPPLLLWRERESTQAKRVRPASTQWKREAGSISPRKKSVSTSDDFTRNAARAVAVETVFVMVYRV